MEFFLPDRLKERIRTWREAGYACNFPAVAEILDFALLNSESGERSLRYLRKAQFEALETYWYLRVVEKTPHIFDLYQRIYPDTVELFRALGIKLSDEDYVRLLSGGGSNAVFERIKSDDEFAKKYKLQIVRESLLLAYPSYILALAMGAGKTVLIGAIIASEFALATEYPDGFVKNALVFAPGKTILGALREISDVPYEEILPPRLYKQFMSSLKITYTQDNEKDIPIVRGSSFNVVVTNTEKIRIQKPTKPSQVLGLLNYKGRESLEEEIETANLRLQTVASLPNLAIFSDEAHHTYGQSLDAELKKVRKTVDYLAANTNLIVVVNTTGTPYYKKQMLRDVVYWYGLAQGIKDGILKEVKDNVVSYENVTSKEFIVQVLEDFFSRYGSVALPDGSESKIAMYFPQTEDLRKFKPIVEKKIRELGFDASTVLEVHNRSDEVTKDFFNNRVNESHNPYRVYLLVNMGTEGWNCPSLFSTALVRKLKTSNNFVLQAASRCLRQVAGNRTKARIYLSKENVSVLDSQLRETYGETLQTLIITRQEMRKEKLVLRKTEIPPFVVKRKIRRVVPTSGTQASIALKKPSVSQAEIRKVTYDVKARAGAKVLTRTAVETITSKEQYRDIYEVALDISNIYRLNLEETISLLRREYQDGTIPSSHVLALREQIERQTKRYIITEETVEVALALVKLEGFLAENTGDKTIYTAEISYNVSKEDLILRYDEFKEQFERDFGFHYTPYGMDSGPEKEFYLGLLNSLEETPDDIEDVYYTGGITDPKKTDFIFEYKDNKGVWRGYTPDFVIKRKDGKILIVEIKGEVYRDLLKEMALTQMAHLNPEKLKYRVLLSDEERLGFNLKEQFKDWSRGNETP